MSEDLEEFEERDGIDEADIEETVVVFGAWGAAVGTADVLSVCDRAKEERALWVDHFAVGFDGADVFSGRE